MQKTISITEYLMSIKNVLSDFLFNRQFNPKDITNLTDHTRDIYNELNNIYLSSTTKEAKNNKYEHILRSMWVLIKVDEKEYNASSALTGILISLDLVQSTVIDFYDKTKENNNLETEELPQLEQNPYPRIFTSIEGQRVFEELDSRLIKHPNGNETSQDVNFAYTILHKTSEGYINEHCTPKEFKDWLNETYPDKYNIIKIKDGEGVTEKKVQHYTTIKNSIKQEVKNLTPKG